MIYPFPSPRLLSVDPEKRISAEEALKHPWIAQRNERASMSQRPEALTELRNFNAKRKMKAAITVTQLVNLSSDMAY